MKNTFKTNKNSGLAPILGIIVAFLIIVGGVYFFYRYNENKYSGLNEEIDFLQSGFLAKDNPGMKSGVWYLNYETSGVSPLTMELIFDKKSVCITGVQKALCSLFMKSVYIGSNVTVGGRLQDDGLLVRKLEVMP
ncbi:MAG: hypothetical protein NTW73_01000 [Candidatus Parcubacteria bacterium]|nr:hypothetical protein [Candidatus Parcubacteria bacterium]